MLQEASNANLLHMHKRHVLGLGLQSVGAGCAIVLAKATRHACQPSSVLLPFQACAISFRVHVTPAHDSAGWALYNESVNSPAGQAVR